MPKETTSLLVLFADIVGSTRLYEALGNDVAQQIVTDCMSMLSEVANRFGGRVVKTIGDEILCTLENSDLGARAAREMHVAVRDASNNKRFASRDISIRVGMHFGEVVRESNDVFGDAVNVAARVTALTKSRQVLTTKQTLDALSSELRAASRFIEQTTVKGRTEQLDLYELIWEKKGVTMLVDNFPTPTQSNIRLRIQYHSTEIELGDHSHHLTIGRDEQNDIVVTDGQASRLHARIEFRRNKFMLIDQSINGTYVHIHGKPQVRLRRDEMELQGEGAIGLGHASASESDECIRFWSEGQESNL